MRFKLDENLPREVGIYLTNQDHDVDTVLDEQLGGQSDTAVVKAASTDDRILLTLDRGVGDLRRFPPGSHPGIFVFRPASQDPGSLLALVDRLTRSQQLEALSGAIVIVEPARTRVRRPERNK